MKKRLFYPLLIVFLLFASYTSKAQTFSAWGVTPSGADYDTINFIGDTLRFQFSGCPAGAFGQGRVVVYFQGDISDSTELLSVNFGGSSSLSSGPYDFLGTAGPNRALVNCAPEDSNEVALSVDTINAYAPDMAIIVIPNNNVGVFCASNRVRVRLEYNYCPFGPPVEFASLILLNDIFCSTDGSITLNGTPSGGVYAGMGVSGNSFDPAGLAPGTYTITYTAADSIGCISTASSSVLIKNTPVVRDTTICVGLPVTLTGSNGSLIWYSDAALTTPIDTGNTYTTPALYQNTSYYVAFSCSDYYFRIDTLLADSINFVNNNALVGDDRGGIAVTPQYIYYIADNGTVRYDADLQNPLGPLPTRDGFFSDLASGELFSLWNTTSNTEPQNNSTNYTVNAIRALNADLSFGTGITNLSTPINLGNTNYFKNGIFAGAGILGLYSGNTQHFYVINTCNGDVKDLGQNTNPGFRGTENSWCDWGIIEYDGTDYSVIYRPNAGNDIVRLMLPAGTSASVGTFPAGIADMACITYSPWNKNWYYHYEGTSGALGGTQESTGYANASDSMSVISGGSLSCSDQVNITVNNIDLGPDTTLCQQNFMIVAGLGYASYTWNGITSVVNSYTATTTDTVVFQGLYQNGCNHLDTIIVTMNPNPGVNLGTDISSCGPAQLDAGAGSSYLWSDASTSQTLSAAASGTYTVTVTNANGCSASDDINVNINSVPTVTLALNPSLVCINLPPYLLSGGSPAGGTWSGTGVSGGSFIPSFAGTGTFAITYTYTDSNGCSNSDVQNLVVDPCTGIAEAFGNGSVSIAPNPGNGLFVLSATATDLKKFDLEVSDMNGKIVYASKENSFAGTNLSLDLSFLSEGIYVMKLMTEKQTGILKLVIQK